MINGSLIRPLIAETGQARWHLLQPLHRAGSISITLSCWQAPAGQRLSTMCASYSSRKLRIVDTTG